MTPHLEKLRDELAAEYSSRLSHPQHQALSETGFVQGFNAAITALEREAGFDEDAAVAEDVVRVKEPFEFTAGARWQFEQDRARIAFAAQNVIVLSKRVVELASRAEKAESIADIYHDKIQSLIAEQNEDAKREFAYADENLKDFRALQAKLAAAEARIKELEALLEKSKCIHKVPMYLECQECKERK